jgi:ribose transport system permease protein
VIESINGTPTLSVVDLGALLRNQADKQVLLRVKDAKTRKSRDVVVVPVSPEDDADLRYGDWETSRRLAVEEKGKREIGYVHLRAMGGDDWGTAIVGIIVSIGVGILWGTFNGILISKAKVPPLIVTLGSLGMALGLAQILTGGVDIREVPSVLTDSIGYGNIFGAVPIISVIALVVVIIGALVLHKTKFGLYTYAVGSSEEAARRVGVKVDRHLIRIYAISGGLAGLAGILSLSQFGTTAIAGQSQTNLNVIAAVVIGGTSLFGGYGTIFGTVVGLFIPAVLQNGFVITGVQPFWQQVAVGAVLILAVYVDQVRRSSAARGGSTSFWRALVSRKKK